MIIEFPKFKYTNIEPDDTIAITRDEKLIGYGTVLKIFEDKILLDVGKNIEMYFNELKSKSLSCSFEMC